MTDAMYQRFVKRWEEVTDLKPQTVGPFTPYYHGIVKRLKVMPWPALVLVAVCLVVGIYILIGSAVTILTSVLQKGF